jgi:hypothetical protein
VNVCFWETFAGGDDAGQESLCFYSSPKGAYYMKKILVLSDSHGNLNNMILAVKNTSPDMIIHLGDCWADAQKLRAKFPDIPMEQVPGNCDCSQEFQERILLIEGKKILICHGHTFNVKAGYLNLQYGAEEKQVDAALFGHTHRVFYGNHNHIIYLNPGSIGSPAYGVPPSYGILQIDGSTDSIDYDVIYME